MLLPMFWGKFFKEGWHFISTLWANFDPQGLHKLAARAEVVFLGVKIFCLLLHSSEPKRVFTPRGEQRGEHSPLGANFTPGGKLHPWGQTHIVKSGVSQHVT
jgi:hypothetical protein